MLSVVWSDESGKLLYYKNKGELVPEGEIVITHATFTFDAKLKPGVFEIRYISVLRQLQTNYSTGYMKIYCILLAQICDGANHYTWNAFLTSWQPLILVLFLSLCVNRIGDSTVELEASGREEMFTWLQELQARRKDIVKQHRATARAQVTHSLAYHYIYGRHKRKRSMCSIKNVLL